MRRSTRTSASSPASRSARRGRCPTSATRAPPRSSSAPTRSASIKDTRGGFRLNFTAPVPVIDEMEFSLANYWTYLDTPMVQSFVSRDFPRADQQRSGAGLPRQHRSRPRRGCRSPASRRRSASRSTGRARSTSAASRSSATSSPTSTASRATASSRSIRSSTPSAAARAAASSTNPDGSTLCTRRQALRRLLELRARHRHATSSSAGSTRTSRSSSPPSSSTST